MQSIDEDQLPHVTSSVERFLVNTAGAARGMVLFNGVEVHFRAHLSSAVHTSIHVGDRITVYGLLLKAAPTIAAFVIEAANGARIVDDDLDTFESWCQPAPA
jgi:hypothetical protein